MASRQTYLGYATTTADILTSKWFGPNGPSDWIYQSNDFWRTPNVVTTLADLMALTETTAYLSTAVNARDCFDQYFNPPNQFPGYYDDEAWWGACFLKLAALTGDDRWTQAASPVFMDLQGGWDDTVGGGVWWEREPKNSPPNIKASVENEVYMEIAMGLCDPGAGSADPHLGAAVQTWQWLGKLIDSQGLVWGNLEAGGAINTKNVPRPYTQGVVLAPLWSLYEATGDTGYLDSAELIAQAAITTMTWPDGILREICEERGTCGPSDLNPPLFKGIFARYLGEFALRLATSSDPARVAAAQRFAAFLQANADALWTNYPNHVFGMDWHTPSPDYRVTGVAMYDGCLQASALDLFIAAARTSS